MFKGIARKHYVFDRSTQVIEKGTVFFRRIEWTMYPEVSIFQSDNVGANGSSHICKRQQLLQGPSVSSEFVAIGGSVAKGRSQGRKEGTTLLGIGDRWIVIPFRC